AHDGGRVLDTGRLRVTVPATGAAFLADVAAGSARLAGPVALPALSVHGVAGGAPSRDAIDVETEGPVVTELVVRGRSPQGITSQPRTAAFAGQPYLRLRHTITNMADPHYAAIESLRLTVPARLDAGALGVDGGTRALHSLDEAHELVHEDATPVLV